MTNKLLTSLIAPLIALLTALLLTSCTSSKTAVNPAEQDLAATPLGNGIISVASAHSVNDTANRFQNILDKKGLTLFQRINHSGNAERAGLSLSPTELIIFGNPKLGTPLMNCANTVAIDLPQKVLFWKDDEGQVWLSYNDPQYLKQRHSLSGCDPVIDKISGALAGLSKAATSP